MRREGGTAYAGRQARAWTAFWQEQGADSRCLAHAQADVRRAFESHWAAFAALLRPRARLLDIGCGAGVVGRNLLAARPDLLITGIDAARVPASSDPRIALLSETPMEILPFENGGFDGAVSQFGFEYGDVAQAAKEVARVLAPGAPFSFVVHHFHSAIVRQSRGRDPALRALLGDGVKRAFLSGAAVSLDRQLWPIRNAAPADPIVGQVAQALQGRMGFGRGQRIAVWNAIVDALAPERELIAALDASCVAPDALERWLANLSDQLEVMTASALCRPTGETIAWKIEGVRSRAREFLIR
jgi:SAM-dependent methyltransferase